MRGGFRGIFATGTVILGFLMLVGGVNATTLNAPTDYLSGQAGFNVSSAYGIGGGGGGGGGGYTSVVNQSSPACVSGLNYYSSIQPAINGANNSNTIYVCAGTYNENVDVNKSVNLIGAGADVTIVNASNPNDHVFNLSNVNSVNISGFTVTGANGIGTVAGIYVNLANNTDITDNVVNNNKYGIFLQISKDNEVRNNTASSNTYGVYLKSSENNSIQNNNASLNGATGINLDESSNGNTIKSNTASGSFCGIDLHDSVNNTLVNNTANSNDWCGIYLVRTSNNTVKNNIANSNNRSGIRLSSSNYNVIINNKAMLNSEVGIRLGDSDNNLIENNNVSKNSDGFYLQTSNKNIIVNNTATSNDRGTHRHGIHLYYSSDNVITNNYVSNNSGGIYIYYLSDNTIYHNNFIDNANQSFDNGNNTWDNGYPSGGNYWSDYDESSEGCDDADSDGFCDSPYNISGGSNQDRYPFTVKDGWLTACTYELNWLPPVSLNKTFNKRSTVPIKFNVTSNGGFVSDESVLVRVFGPNNSEVFNATYGKDSKYVRINIDEGYYIANLKTDRLWPYGNYSINVGFSGTCGFEKTIELNKKGKVSTIDIGKGRKVKSELPGIGNFTFDNVTEEGYTTLVKGEENTGGSMPSGFNMVGEFYDISTTASFTGNVSVCLNDLDVQIDNMVFHWDGSKWEEVTSSVDAVNDIICGNVSSFSPFVVTEPSDDDREGDSSGGGGGGGTSKPKIILLANSIDYSLASNFTAFLKTQGIEIIYTTPENFSSYKNQKFIVILGGPDSPDGMGDITREVLNLSEQEELRAPGAEKMYVKNNVWESYFNQVVFVVGGQ